jgi:putative tryptophan/tyrosine transport system substrate-binding protein
MRRRELVTLLCTASLTPIGARSQERGIPVIGFLNSGTRAAFADRVGKFQDGLRTLGFVEGKNIAVEYRFAEGRYERLPELASDLVGRGVKAVAATGGDVAALAAKAATSTVPMVFVIGGDPIEIGLVPNLNSPHGNITGLTIYASSLAAKRLELLRELTPKAGVIAILSNPTSRTGEAEIRNAQQAAQVLRQTVRVFHASTDPDLQTAFAAMKAGDASALLVIQDAFFNTRRRQVVALAASHGIPAIYYERVFASEGGLISYGSSIADGYRQAGVYVASVLNGTKPADLPVLQPTKFELVINSRTAREQGVGLPPTLLAIADEVIE